MDGMPQGSVEVLYNENVQRTEFVYARLTKSTLKPKSYGCSADNFTADEPLLLEPNDEENIGQIVSDQFGGSCTEKNLFLQNRDCSTGLWADYTNTVARLFDEFDEIAFCVKMIYPDKNETTRPVKIRSSAYTNLKDPKFNIYLEAITIDNPISGKCHQLPEIHVSDDESDYNYY